MRPQAKRFFLLKLAVIAVVFALSRTSCAFGATSKLPEDEVQALRDIAKSLGKRDWNFSVDPCSGESGWVTPNTGLNALTCNCSFSDAPTCHVVSIVLEGQSLQGKPPPEIIKLPFLQKLNLNNNYLNGTLPSQWASTKLLHITLAGNRISGFIPKEFGNISTLVNFTVEDNQLSGAIPLELGNLANIERFYLTSNNFSGELPTTLGKLTTLKELWISDNQFTGNIPTYIQNWTNLERLFIQGSGLNGPIPSGIAGLVKLTDLRISDLSGPEEPFPPLNNLKNLRFLILRSCNIIGRLPGYLGEMRTLYTLDLSFNKLTGEIPSNFTNLANVQYIYLTGNLLTGLVPDWIKRGSHNDLSYNNFTVDSSTTCQQGSVNLFGSSLNYSNSGIACLRSFRCPKKSYSLHINCGGQKVTVGGKAVYEDDTHQAGPSNFIQSSPTWTFSNTGHFMDDSATNDLYITSSSTKLSMKNSELYINARLSPISLTYYGLCLENGMYAVKLHFAELMFTDDETYNSLGRRIFNIYIQGKLVQKDFNIAAEAGGVRKPIVKPFSAAVTNNTLEIRLYWAGKGTTGIPTRGVYGPLISAISADSDSRSLTLSLGTIFGIVVAVAFVILLILGILWWKGCIGQRNAVSKALQTRTFSLRQIKSATNNFDDDNKIGEGGFGPVYKGVLFDGTIIAVKQLSSKSKQGTREFLNEIGMISALQHPNLVNLYGCCTEGNQLLLVYEYLENNSLAHALFGPEEHRLELGWPTRHMICVGIARCLAYLHEESRLKIVHRDIKATNILLDKDLNAKISDFGLAKLYEEDNTHISTRIAGTYGYMAPEYAMRGHLSDKADVYSFGVVALEIVCGKRSIWRESEWFSVLDSALVILQENGNLIELVDSRLGSDYNKEQAMDMVKVALLCTNVSSAARPTMSSVVSMLEGSTGVPDPVLDSNIDSNSESRFLAMKKHFEELSMSDTTTDSHSLLQSSTTMSSTIEGPSTTSSSADLYSVHNYSGYGAVEMTGSQLI